MTQIQWRNNDNSGAFIERQLRQIQAQIENTQDVDVKLERMKSYTYIWDIKARIVKTSDHEDRIEALETLLRVKNSGVISK